ncbi:MAG: sulfurtransferase TusA family protein [Thermodesulfobacteriota bacterium]|nr:sulfurtransferase TusA family protein [Thermodesulfobacteriota bacterium]
MTERVDARGLSCPLPVINAQRKMKEMGSGTFEVIIDSATSRDNVTRMATKEGWDVKTKEEGEDILMILTK